MLQKAIFHFLGLLFSFFIIYKWEEKLAPKIYAKFFELKNKWGDFK